MRYSLEPRHKKTFKDMDFYNLQENLEKNGKKLLNPGISSTKKFSTSKYGKKITDTTKKGRYEF